jgi:cytochrome P450
MTVERKYDLYSREMKADPFPIFAAMRRDDPIFVQLGLDGHTLIWFATRHADVEKILTDEGHFQRDGRAHGIISDFPDPLVGELVENHMLNRDGDDHRRLRSLVSKAFTPKRVRDMRPRIQQITDDLINKVIDKGEMELVAEFAFPLPITVIQEMLGIPPGDHERFRRWSNAVLAPAVEPGSQRVMLAKLAEFVAYLQALFVERQNNPAGDLVSALIHAEEGGDRLTEGELLGMMMLLIIAGHETTVNLISNALVALWQHQDQLALLQADPGLMPAAIEEFVRFGAPVERGFNRFLAVKKELDGQILAEGEMIIPLLAAANRDPAVFTDPDRLDVTRTPNPHLGFGKGPHYCLGAPLARLEAVIALNTLLRRLPNLRPAVALEELQWRTNPMFRSLESLPVTWNP